MASVLLILVDGAEHRRKFNECLADSPHRLVYTFDGEDAFDRFAEVKPDLVIAYEHSAKLDATLLCQLLRRQAGGADTPFVLLAKDDAPPERLRTIGADAALRPDFDRRTLLKTLAPLLSFGRPEITEDLDLSTLNVPALTDSELMTRDLEESSPLVLRAMSEADFSGAPALAPESDEVPTGEILVEPTHPLDEPLAPATGGFVVHEDTNIVRMSDLFPLADQEVSDSSEVPLVSPVADDELETIDPSLKQSATSQSAKKRALIEEPPLPGPGDLGAVESHYDIEDPGRPSTDSLIREIPRERTPPSSGVSAPPGHVAKRGLAESQLGKRLTHRVRSLHRLLDELDYYQLLAVERDATPEQIRDGYFGLSLEFHPDRFFLIRDGDLKEQIYAIYRRISEAYSVLNDSDRRAMYDEHIGAHPDKRAPEALRHSVPPEPASPLNIQAESRVAGARRFIELAEAALEGNDTDGARLYLNLAAVQDEGNASIEASLAAVISRLRAAQNV